MREENRATKNVSTDKLHVFSNGPKKKLDSPDFDDLDFSIGL